MMQNFNYHGHTYRCGHSDASISDEEYVELFISKGFKKIAFTDHCPYKDKIDFRNNMRMDYSKKEDYYKSIKFLKEKYKDMINIELGFEMEYVPGYEDYLFELKKETDKVILGQHFVCGDNKDGITIIGWGSAGDNDIIAYANYIKKAIEIGLPDIIAHPDLFMYHHNKFSNSEIEATHIICKAAEAYQIPLEINLTRASAFLCNRTNEIEYPNKKFWEIASNYNIKVVYGVDAHFRDQINNYEDCIKLVNEHLGDNIINKLNFVNEDL